MVYFFSLVVLLSSSVWANFATSTLPPIVPAVHNFTGSPNGDFKLASHARIVVDAAQASSREDNGLSLIPPTLSSFAYTFAADLKETFPKTEATVILANLDDFNPRNGDIILTILSNASASNFTLAKGIPTSEGYEMEVNGTAITIKGSGAKGSFWGTRTLLQGLILTNGSFPGGVIKDQPDWQTRGFMLGK